MTTPDESPDETPEAMDRATIPGAIEELRRSLTLTGDAVQSIADQQDEHTDTLSTLESQSDQAVRSLETIEQALEDIGPIDVRDLEHGIRLLHARHDRVETMLETVLTHLGLEVPPPVDEDDGQRPDDAPDGPDVR
jgi:septal ring factor EnvC (AmiA/AmiB activator)